MNERQVAARLRDGDPRALARAVTWLEAFDPRGARLLAAARRRALGSAHVVGVTGAPGGGKSTLVDALIKADREAGRRVAVVAVDPTSSYTGGALLGDRVRLAPRPGDDGLFVRSMATRGHLGGLAASTLQVAGLLEAVGFDRVVVETVGVGQSEVDVVAVADTTLLVTTPEAGDGVQAVKAGVSEIADVIVVNKSDLPGAERMRRDLRAAQTLGDPPVDGWRPPVLLTRARDGGGVPQVLAAVAEHRAHLEAHGGRARRRRARVRAEVEAAVRARAHAAWVRGEADLTEAVLQGRLTADEAAERALTAAAGGTLPPP